MLFEHSRRIYLGDTDAAGVVYFAKGMEIYHEAYEEYLASLQIDLQQILNEKKIALPIVEGKINFFAPLFCGDRITIKLTANLINNSQFQINYQIFNIAQSPKKAIAASTQHVCIDPNQRKRIDLPTAILNSIKN